MLLRECCRRHHHLESTSHHRQSNITQTFTNSATHVCYSSREKMHECPFQILRIYVPHQIIIKTTQRWKIVFDISEHAFIYIASSPIYTQGNTQFIDKLMVRRQNDELWWRALRYWRSALSERKNYFIKMWNEQWLIARVNEIKKFWVCFLFFFYFLRSLKM